MLGLSVRDLVVTFSGLGRPALSIPKFDIAAGERIAITGPSGCGKTTFLNIVTGLERTRRGSVRWGDVDLADRPEVARDRWRARSVGLVMQEFHLFAGLSALDNVLLPARLAGVRAGAELKAEGLRLLERVDIERPQQPVETMSRGQMQRVAVARALVARPAIIVADEPTASLDAEAGATVADLLLRLTGDAGSTLIVASHDRRLIERLDRAVRLRVGEIVGDSPRLAELPDEAFL
jgi:putative ABC transport system ATP-binding protein